MLVSLSNVVTISTCPKISTKFSLESFQEVEVTKFHTVPVIVNIREFQNKNQGYYVKICYQWFVFIITEIVLYAFLIHSYNFCETKTERMQSLSTNHSKPMLCF